MRFIENAVQIWVGWLIAAALLIWLDPWWVGAACLAALVVACAAMRD